MSTEMATQAAMVSQLTSLAVLGISGRRFRELVISLKIRHVRLGKLVLVSLEDWMRAMAPLVSSGQVLEPEPEETTPTVDDYLRRLGRVRS